DRFKVVIPFAGQTLRWEVIFSDVDMPPDLSFGSHDAGFVPDITSLQFLNSWDLDDPNSLVSLLQELIGQYKQYQADLVARIPRLQFDCDFLTSSEEYSDFEILSFRGNQSYENIVNIFIRIPVDLDSIPPYLIAENPGKDIACLLISYQSPEGSVQVTPKLFLSPRLERAFGRSSSLHIPPWGGQNGSCLMDYVPAVHQMLKQKVKAVSSGYRLRKDYASAFLSLFGGSVLEYDAGKFHSLSLLFKVQGFCCILKIHLSVGFPLDKPSFTLHSIYHESNGIPYHEEHKNYSYSPRWSPSEMAEAARSYLLQAVPEFKESSLSNGTF
ncbi:predicted protein, partial [Nematostella vectensis]